MTDRRRDTDGPKRRREDELEELLEHGSRNFRRYRRRAYLGFVGLAVVSAWALKQNAEVADRAGTLAQEIQQQRIESILTSCVEQNARHDQTIRALDSLIASAPAERRERARQGRQGTVLLIDALAPRRDCREVVERAAPPTGG